MFATFLVLNEYYKVEITGLKLDNDSLRKANEALKSVNQKLQAAKECHIKLDVTGLTYRGDSVK